MAVEPKRGCGYRKVGGLYLVCEGPMSACCALPYPLEVCPTCGSGIKPARGWTWINAQALFSDVHCWQESIVCPVRHPPERAGLLWIGEQYYPTPEHFLEEARTMGISRRITAIPKGFEVGRTRIYFAHRKAIEDDEGHCPGVFSSMVPYAIEKIVRESELDDELRDELGKRGITPIPVPDGDPHHDPNGKPITVRTEPNPSDQCVFCAGFGCIECGEDTIGPGARRLSH